MEIEDLKFHSRVVEISVPFAHDPSNHYIGGVAFQDKSHYWRLKYNKKVLPQKWNEVGELLYEFLNLIEEDRLKMLNNEFNEMIMIENKKR